MIKVTNPLTTYVHMKCHIAVYGSPRQVALHYSTNTEIPAHGNSTKVNTRSMPRIHENILQMTVTFLQLCKRNSDLSIRQDY